MTGSDEGIPCGRLGPARTSGLFALAVAIHVPFLLRRPFFFADDFGCLADADNLTRGSSRFLELPAWGVWRLGQRAFWWAEYGLFGLDPLPYHAVNVLLHAAVAVTLAALLVRLGAARGRALLAGALFASLSAPSITVRYPSVSAVILAVLFALLAIGAHESERPLLGSALMLVGASFYEQALCAPAAMLLVNLVLRRRPWWRGLAAPAGAAVVFLAGNLWTLRGTTKVFAYNTGGARAILQAIEAPLTSLGWTPAAGIAVAVLAGALILAAAVSAARGILPGLLFAWISVGMLLGRDVNWSEWYFYLPAAGAATALALAFPRAWPWAAACLAFCAWNVSDQVWRFRYFADQAENYRQITFATPPSHEAKAAVFVNVHSGLAWAAWQFGGSTEDFELWASPDGRARCYAGRDLGELRARMLAEVSGARRRSRWPEDLPPGMRAARAPARHELFPWPRPGS